MNTPALTAEQILQGLYKNLEADSYAWWLPEWAIVERTKTPDFPSYEEFIKNLTNHINKETE